MSKFPMTADEEDRRIERLRAERLEVERGERCRCGTLLACLCFTRLCVACGASYDAVQAEGAPKQ